MVPTPRSVNSSSKTAWAMRPSKRCAAPTPARSAATQAVALGAMPPVAAPLVTMASSSSAPSWATRVAGSAGSRRIPSTSVSTTSFAADSAAASAPATASALTLYAWPIVSEPIVATTGTRPWAKRPCRSVGSTASTSPTKPSPSSRSSTRKRLASKPETPTASGPWQLMAATSSLLTLPTSTIRAMSKVSRSVTRCPPTNSLERPSLASSSAIWGPPPWTTTGARPTERSSATSSANDASAPEASSAPASAAPPYFTTTTAPWNRRMYGSASTRIAATSRGTVPATGLTRSSGSRRGSPARGRSRAPSRAPVPSPRSQWTSTWRPARCSATAARSWSTPSPPTQTATPP